MNQISRNHKTGGLNSKYEIWAVSEGYFPSCFQCSRGSCMPSLGERVLVGWSWGLHMLINPSSLCWSLRWSSCPPNPLSLPRCSALPHCGALLLLPHISDELPGRAAEPQCPSCRSGEQQLLAPGLFSSLWIGGEEETSLFSAQTLIRERRSFEYSKDVPSQGHKTSSAPPEVGRVAHNTCSGGTWIVFRTMQELALRQSWNLGVQINTSSPKATQNPQKPEKKSAVANFLCTRLSGPICWRLGPQAGSSLHPQLQIWMCWQERETSSVSCLTWGPLDL